MRLSAISRRFFTDRMQSGSGGKPDLSLGVPRCKSNCLAPSPLPQKKGDTRAPRSQVRYHYNVYVIELSKEVLLEPRFRKANRNYQPEQPCVYVGMSGLDPDDLGSVPAVDGEEPP